MRAIGGNARIRHVANNFTIVPNSALADRNLSYRAKGIYAFLRSKPDNWEFRMDNVVKSSTEGRDAVTKAVQELEKAGYIQRFAAQDETGKYQGWIWYVHETPVNKASDRCPEKPSVGFPERRIFRQSENQGELTNTINNNNINNNNISNNAAVAVFAEYDINILPVIQKNPTIFDERSVDDITRVARILAQRRDAGKIDNPVGLLLAKPAIVDDILRQRRPAKKRNYNNFEVYGV